MRLNYGKFMERLKRQFIHIFGNNSVNDEDDVQEESYSATEKPQEDE